MSGAKTLKTSKLMLCLFALTFVAAEVTPYFIDDALAGKKRHGGGKKGGNSIGATKKKPPTNIYKSNGTCVWNPSAHPTVRCSFTTNCADFYPGGSPSENNTIPQTRQQCVSWCNQMNRNVLSRCDALENY